MKINFIVPFTSMTGGIRVVYEYCNRLQEKGHDVIVYVPMKAYRFNNTGMLGILKTLKASIENTVIRGENVKWFDLKVKIKLVPIITEKFIRDADTCIATAWPTAYDVGKLSKNKGKKVYLIQHYETWSGDKELVDNSYKLNLYQIVIAKWLKELMRIEFKKEAKLIYSGIDENEYYFVDKNNNKNEIVISILNHSLEWKGYEDGIKAIEIAKEKYPNMKLKIFGLKKEGNIPDYAEFYENPTREELKQIYIDSDIYVFPSKKEGWGLTVIEAMACKCAVAGTNTGAIAEVGKHNENCLISNPEDIEGLSYNIIKLIEDAELRHKLSNNAFNLALEFQWCKSIEKFEKYIEKLD